jgi:hypothetical protein
MNKYIKSVMSKLFPKKELPKHMGRWGIENTNRQIDYKIDLSNEDHCGPCGQYALSKTKKQLTNPTTTTTK